MDESATESVVQPGAASAPRGKTVYTGLSGNEMFCLNQLGYSPGDLLVGNSVFSLGFIGGIRSSVRNLVGGEVKAYTEIIAEGRRLSYERLENELAQSGGLGATGVTSELVIHAGNIEFLSVASALHGSAPLPSGTRAFTSSADGQELYC